MSGYEGMTIEAGDKITKGIKKSESNWNLDFNLSAHISSSQALRIYHDYFKVLICRLQWDDVV